MTDLTKVQRRLLTLIKQHIAKHGRPPTVRELSDYRGVNIFAIQQTLFILERKGKIRRTPGRSRAIELLDKEPPGIPILGSVG